ncbi:ralA-binding protein 1 [Microplitis demolitor]|uniref:ralA-binding protein 1 n=1 Tax=Microplitis demolitor TaxID=69319 RepID=UPI00043FFF64|nr:ralA-binding protein 1 [Microplitis demolitor]
MDFESPDVEKEFPGLYASESARKSNESDFSDDGSHDKHSKKELLGKKKDKKDRKDRGYATLEGESSPDEDQETKSPSKSKKTKTFKFPSKKREKSREKDSKEKETDKDKDKDKKKRDKDEKEDKDKRKDKDKDKDKLKYKLKDRKKKHDEDIGEVQPIFGVSLQLAVERSRCHDGIELPLVVRNCIDYIEEFGMTTEGLYRVPGVKSKVQHFKKLYNQRDNVNTAEFEPTVATSLLILFFRELPEAVLESSETISRFEQAASTKEVSMRESQLYQLVHQLPECNRVLLGWVICHLDHVTAREKTTKMNAQAIAMTLSPVLQMSHRLCLALLCHCKALFPDVTLDKYIPPLSSGSLSLPDTPETIAKELAKQESLLEQIHMQMNAGFVTKSREEMLWEVQRIITQLKRKFKKVQKLEGNLQKSLDDEVKSSDENHGEGGSGISGAGSKILATGSGSGTNSGSGISGPSSIVLGINSGTGTGISISGSGTMTPGSGIGPPGPEISGSGIEISGTSTETLNSGTGILGSGSGTGLPGSGMGLSGPGSGTGISVSGSGTGASVAGSGTGGSVLGSGAGFPGSGSGTGTTVAGSGTGLPGSGTGISGSGTGISGSGSGTEIPGLDLKPDETKDVVDCKEKIKEEEEEKIEENSLERIREILIHDELINMETVLRMRIQQERNEIKKLNEMIIEKPERLKVKEKERIHSPNEAEITAMIQLAKENQLLEKKMMTLIRSIIEEKDACVELRVQLAMHQLMRQKSV